MASEDIVMIKSIEPFAYGYYHCKDDNVSMKIAHGFHAVCKYVPISIDLNIGLPEVNFFSNTPDKMPGVRLHYGHGIECRSFILDEEIAQYPDFAEELSAYKAYFTPLVTYDIYSKSLSDLEWKLRTGNTLNGGFWGGHSNPNFYLFPYIGTDGLREKIRFYKEMNTEADALYESMLHVLDGIDILGLRFHNLAIEQMEKDPEHFEIYQDMAKAFEIIPQKPAYDFVSACQYFYMIFTLDGSDSPGRFDQYMYPFFLKTEKEKAILVLERLWKGFQKNRAWNICIGGSDEHFNDDSNELTYEILNVAERNVADAPNLTMRCHRNTPEELLKRATDVIGTGMGMPALYNDEVVCPALEALGIPPEDSHRYCMNGCNQIDIQGKSHMGLEDGEIYLLKCLEYALFDGTCLITGEKLGLATGNAREFTTFDEILSAYFKQVENAVKITISMCNRSQKVFSECAPNPLRSMMIEGCMESGKDYKCGGPIYNHGQILTEGLADTIDSLASIRHFVFDTKKYTMGEVLDAIEADYEGYEDMRLEFLRYPGKFGNDDEETDALGGRVLSHFFNELLKYHTYRDPINGVYGGGLSTFQRTGRYGSSAGANANGRHSKDVLIADSIGPVPGMDKNGPTAVIKSALHYDQKLAKSGFVLHLKFDKTLFNTVKGKEGFLGLAKAYFANGGQQLSVNVLNTEELLDAQIHPERHGNLIVRVGGYSAYFVSLPKELQDNVISRTTQTL